MIQYLLRHVAFQESFAEKCPWPVDRLLKFSSPPTADQHHVLEVSFLLIKSKDNGDCKMIVGYCSLEPPSLALCKGGTFTDNDLLNAF